MKWLRLIGAGLFVWVGLMAMVGVIGALGGFDGGHWLVGPAGALTFGMLIVAAIYFFKPKGSNALGVRNAEEHLADLVRRDPIVETSFTVRRHRTEHYVIELVCGGEVIEPEVMASGRVIKGWFRDGFAPEDGTILTGIGFDELKRSRAGAPA